MIKKLNLICFRPSIHKLCLSLSNFNSNSTQPPNPNPNIKTATNTNMNTVNKKQMELFNKLSGWWHPSGPSQLLFMYNYKRIEFLRKFVGNDRQPLKGMKVLDVGCGAGFLSQSMARLGGQVTALDPNETSFSQAQSHKSSKKSLTSLTYLNIPLQQYLSTNPSPNFSLTTSMQVLEHIPNPQSFLSLLSQATKPNGLIMLSTIRKNPQTFLKYIVLAQYISGLVPKGTHHYDQFIEMEDLNKMMENVGVRVEGVMELELGWTGDFVEKKGGGNYVVVGRKKAREQGIQGEMGKREDQS